MNRSLGWKWGRLMWCGVHLVRTTYRPSLVGSPATTACLAPPGFPVHWILSGNVNANTLGSGWAALTEKTLAKMVVAAIASRAREGIEWLCMLIILSPQHASSLLSTSNHLIVWPHGIPRGWSNAVRSTVRRIQFEPPGA